MAQQARPNDDLKALIPDSAVNDPQGWAQKAPPGAAPSPAPDAPPVLRPDSPLAPMPAITLPWPSGPDGKSGLDLPQFVSLAPDPDLVPELEAGKAELAAEQARLAPQSKHDRKRQDRQAGRSEMAHGRVTLAYPAVAAFPERDAFEARFRSLSALQSLSGKDANNAGQVGVRATSDRSLLQKLLHVYGYYDGEVYQAISGIDPGQPSASGALSVRFEIEPGTRYKFGAVDLGKLAATGNDYPSLRASFAIHTGDDLDNDKIVAEQGHLATALGEGGYPFAKLGESALLVDHRREAGDLTLPVTPGGKYRYGGITSNLPHYLSGHHLADIARFKPGQVWKASDVDDLRKAILATGLVSSVTVAPRETTAPTGPAGAGDPGTAALDVTMTKAPQRTIAAAVGYDTGEGARVELSWEHRNLFPPEGMLRLRGVLGTQEQLAGVTFRRNNFLGRDRVLTFDLYADNANLDAYAARTVAFTATYERLTTLLFQKPWTWSVGFEAAASLEREGVPSGITTGRIGYITVALPVRGAIDRSDDLLDPHKGWRASLRLSPEVSKTLGHVQPYGKAQFDASFYQPFGDGLVLAGRTRLGAIVGTDIENIAPSRRFYAGGGGSIRGYGYELVGPKNALGEPMGGRSLYEFSLEARVDTGLMGGNLSVVPFLDAGGADPDQLPHFRDMRFGTGLGLRYKTGFGPIRVDVGTPIGRRPGESPIGVYVALGQAF